MKPRVRPTIRHLDVVASDPLGPPWPDAVLTIGRDLSLVALWIKQQSGGRTRVALFNAAKGRASAFDLIVLPPYYRASGHSNELQIRMPLIGIDPSQVEAAHAAFAAQFDVLQRPLSVLLLGGDMGLRKLDPNFAISVLGTMQQSFASSGSIYVSASRRTPNKVAVALEAHLRPQDRLFRWGTPDIENPYLGLLAHGDNFVVTADSLSMIIEVARLGKPMMIAEPSIRTGLTGWWDRLAVAFRARDLRRAIVPLYESGHAAVLGKVFSRPAEPLPDDTARVAERLRQLVLGKVE